MAVRKTKQKSAVRDVLAGAVGPLLPSEVLDVARAEVPGMGIATVYRALAEMVDSGAVRVVYIGGIARYEESSRGHHLHFICNRCNRTFCLGCCPISRGLELPPGFSASDHEVTVVGCCPGCSQSPGLGGH